MNYQDALAFAVDMATAIVATPPERMPFVLPDLRAKGLTSAMIRELAPLIRKTRFNPLIRKHSLSPELAELARNPGLPNDPYEFPGECDWDRIRTMLCKRLSKPKSHFYATAQVDQRYLHGAASELRMVIGTKLCCDRKIRLVWRIS